MESGPGVIGTGFVVQQCLQVAVEITRPASCTASTCKSTHPASLARITLNAPSANLHEICVQTVFSVAPVVLLTRPHNGARVSECTPRGHVVQDAAAKHAGRVMWVIGGVFRD